MTQGESFKRFFYALIFVNVFLILGTFRVRVIGSDTADWQVLMKLGFWLLTFCITILFYRRWLSKIIRFDNIFLTLLLGLIGLSCLYAPSIPYSLGAFFSLIAIHALFYTSTHFMDDEEIISSIFLSISFVCLLSFLAYFLMPEVGRLKEWVGSDEILGKRMSGIVGNPNSMGFCASFGLLCAAYNWRSLSKHNMFFFIGCTLLILLCLILSNSRTSLMSLCFALLAGYFARPTKPRILIFCFAVCFMILSPLFLDYNEIMLSMSRSGNIEEITSGTSRVYIWETSWRLINERPLTGYGYASSNFILPKLADEIGHAPPHTHNIALQIMFSCGYLGLILLICTLIIKLYYCFKHCDYFKIILLFFLIISGISEAILFRGTVSLAQVILALTFALEYKKA